MSRITCFIELLSGVEPKSPLDYPHSVQGYHQYLLDHRIEHTSGIEMTACGRPKVARQLAGTTYLLPEQKEWWFGLGLALIFDRCRKAIGTAAAITSWYRPASYNQLVGGAEESDHIYSRAIDIRHSRAAHRRISQRLVEKEFYGLPEFGIGLGVGETLLHVSLFSPHGTRRWTYSSFRKEPDGTG